MRSLFLASVVTLLAAVPAAADYRRLPGPAPDAGFVLQGDDVLVGAAGVLTAHAPDGSTRAIVLPKTSGKLRWVRASSAALSVAMSNSEYVQLNGGSWRKVGGLRVTPNVSGARVLVLRRNAFDEHGSVDLIDLRSGKRKHFAIKENRPDGVMASGGYLAYMVYHAVSGRETLVVRSIATGREVYRVRPGAAMSFELLPGGRLVAITPGRYRDSYRVQVATPGRPRLRTIRELGLAGFSMGATPSGIALVRSDAQGRADVWLLGFDGRMRALTPRLPNIDRIVYDGRTLAFSLGDCLFAGPIPSGAPPAVPTQGCVRSTDGGAGR